MATKRQRPSGSWEFIIRRKGVLPKAVSLTFHDETEGDAYCARLESLLDRGIVPPDLVDQRPDIATIADAIRSYRQTVSVAESDKPMLDAVWNRVGEVALRSVNYNWAETWVRQMKQEQQLSPSTIRHYVGTLARCLDWLMRRPDSTFVSNPLRLLPKRYSAYTETDKAVIQAANGKTGQTVITEDHARDRRLNDGEEEAIRAIIAGSKPVGRQRPLELKYQAAILLLFDLALETAMRMREMYTLTLDQLDIEKRTIFLDRTKNGDKRQVPLTTVALAAIARYQDAVAKNEDGMAGWDGEGRMFPWWNGETDSVALGKISNRLSGQFARIFSAAECEDLRFHDLRHEASSRFYERTQLSDLQIAKITGHKDPRMLARYANLRGSDLANQLW
ncbi:site-specific integrase [Vogesella indigofera]|uniref:site-specific integrase n=1 Tax=Vogesella indigofera TaxID=45465 RepID=UPI00234E6785|nr:site-specific integrase [Vogesella indigofera]MDC7699556.1 site-specific integrase [Vogesella indigofera]